MSSNRFWRLTARPEDDRFEAALSLEAGRLPDPAEGEVVIRNNYLSMDAGTRLWMTDREDSYNPPLEVGAPMLGLVLGRITQTRHSGFAEGDLVRGFGQWADYSVCVPEEAGLVKLDDSLEDLRQHFGVVGINGWTSLWGLTETARVQPGENVVVSAAAGATGLLACQIANILGCNVYGLTGNPEKCRWLEETLGVARAIDYKTADIAAELATIEGSIHVYFDNVGGPILDAVLPTMAMFGRVAVCGLMDQYKGDGRAPGPARFDQVLMKRLRIEGFFVTDFFAEGERLTAQLKTWLDDGRLFTPFDVTDGLENTLTAYGKLFSGANIGKVLVRVGAVSCGSGL